MTNFIPKTEGNIVTADFECFPTELENGWIFIHEFKNNKLFSNLFSMYKGDDFPRGTVVVSPYIYHRYPDIYSLYEQPNAEGIILGSRGQINPRYRGRKWWTWYAYMTRVIFWGNFKKHIDVTPERNTKMETFYQKARKDFNQDWQMENTGRNKYPDEEMPRDPIYPYIWYNHRVGGKIEEE